MSFVKELFQKNRWVILSGILLAMASALANIAAVSFINRTIASGGKHFLEGGAVMALLLAALFVFGVLSQWAMTSLAYRIIYQMRGRLLTQVLQAEFEHVNELGKGTIYAALTRDIRSVQDGFVVFPFFAYSMTLIVGGFAYMLWLSWQLALLCILGLAVAIMIGQNLTSRYQRMSREDRELEDGLFQQYEKILDGHKELLLNEKRRATVLREVMEGAALRSRTLRAKADRYIVLHLHMMTVATLGLIGLIFCAVYLWHWADAALGASFAVVLLFIRQPINVAINQLPAIFTARIALQKLASLDLPEPEHSPPAGPLSTEWNTLSLREIAYRYPGNDAFEFGRLNLELKRGELIFIVGHNGAGKSTLTRLLTGLIVPTEGRIVVDGITINDGNRRQYRAMFSAVLTDFFLFEQVMETEGTAIDDAEAARMLKRLQLNEFVSVRDGIFSQTALSTGQRKRLAMVAACMERRSVMVLDEWAADQDPYFRKFFYEAILPELKAQGITTIVVSHDERYFHVADRVMKLERGSLSQENELHERSAANVP